MQNFINENPVLLREKGTAADNAGETLANFSETEAADNILFYAIEKRESNNAKN